MDNKDRQAAPTRVAKSGDDQDFWDVLHIPESVQQAVGSVADVVGAVSTAVSWVGYVQTVMKLAGLLTAEPSPFEKLVGQIQSEIRVLMSATIAGTTEERLRDVAEQSAIAKTASIHANEYILLGRPDQPFHIDRLAQADRDSLLAVQVLSSDAWWHRTYDPTPVVWRGKNISGDRSEMGATLMSWWGDPSAQIKPVQPVNGLVWDYRHILPSYVHAVAARIVVLKARSRNVEEFIALAQNEIHGFASFLTGVRDRIFGAIRSAQQYPLHGEPSAPLTTSNPGNWRGAGAVELYSGLHDWIVYDWRKQGTKTRGEDLARFANVQFDSRNRVYRAVGLDELTRVIEDLRRMLVRPCGAVTGGNVGSSAAVVDCQDNHPVHHVFVAGQGGLRITYKHGRDGNWGWHSAGQPPGGGTLQPPLRPAATVSGEGAARQLFAFAAARFGPNLHLVAYIWNGTGWGWSDLGSLGYQTMGNPAATAFALDGRRHVRAYLVSGGQLHAKWWDGTAWSWMNLHRPVAQQVILSQNRVPSVTSYRYNGRLLDDAYIVGPEGRLFEHAWYADGQRAWTALLMNGHNVQSDPVVVSHEENGQAHVDVFVLDNAGRLLSLEWRPGRGWSWAEYGTPAGASINVSAGLAATTLRYGDQPPLTLAVVATTDDHVWVRRTQAGGSWYDLAGDHPRGIEQVLGVSAHVRENGTIPAVSVYVRTTDQHIHTTEYGFWDTWHDLGRA